MYLDVTIIGGGMIVHDQILPSLYHLQRTHLVGEISVCATSTRGLRDLVNDPEINEGFAGHTFTAYPPLSEPADKRFGDLYKQVIPNMKKRQVVVVATPDPLHFEMVMFCLEHDQHVLCVKPLVLKYEQAKKIEELAERKGLLVGVEYHKRFDRRALEARKSYRLGRFGQFKAGEARLIEPWNYRHSNFQNWFTTDQTDPFTYIGCHYVDLVYFITGLRPVEVSVQGVEGTFPNGKRGYMWSSGRVVFENGGMLSVINGLGYPDTGAGSNDQGITMYCEGNDAGGVIVHNDQFRGVQHGYTDKFKYINPDYFRLVPWDGPGLRPVGYGFESVAGIIVAAVHIEQSAKALSGDDALKHRQSTLQEIDARGIIATPANSYINELVVEAGRQSILAGGKQFVIEYKPTPHVRAK
jgi:predicted dehydrogenase